MKTDWKQEIAEEIRKNCDHGSGSSIVGPGCSKCQVLFMRIVRILDSALDTLAGEIGDYAPESTPNVIRRFKRSIPNS